MAKAKATAKAKTTTKAKVKSTPAKAKTAAKTAKPAAKAAKPAAKAAKSAKPAKAVKATQTAKTAKPTKTAAKPTKAAAPTSLLTKVAKAAVSAVQGAVSSIKKTTAGEALTAFTPLDDRVLIEVTGVSDRTPGGLYIPETASSSDRPSQGKVVAVGRGHLDKKGRLRKLDVQLGDTVMFAAFAGSEVKIGDRELTMLREKDLIAIVK